MTINANNYLIAIAVSDQTDILPIFFFFDFVFEASFPSFFSMLSEKNYFQLCSVCKSCHISILFVFMMLRPTVSVVNSGGLSLTSVILIIVVAVLDRPYVGFPSISVAWMIRVYWVTFCKQTENKESQLMEIKILLYCMSTVASLV